MFDYTMTTYEDVKYQLYCLNKFSYIIYKILESANQICAV